MRGMVWRSTECCGEGGWCGGVKSAVVRGDGVEE